jgi:hypothetical protein
MLLSQIGVQERRFAHAFWAHDQHKSMALGHARGDGS